MHDKKDLVSVTLLDERRGNPRVVMIPRFTREPGWVAMHNKVYLRDHPGVYVEAFGWSIGFREEKDA